jgi:hypothetical protein
VATGQQTCHAVLDLGRFADYHRVKLTEEYFECSLRVHGRTLT